MSFLQIKKKITATTLVAAMAVGMVFGIRADATRSVEEIQQDRISLQNEINALDAELVDLLVDIDTLSSEIAENEGEIEELQIELVEAKKAEKKQYKYMKKRMKAMYENDQKSLVTMLLESGSFSDFLNKIEYANAVYEYDQQLLNTYIGVKEEIKEMENSLEKEQASLQSEKSALSSKEASLNSMIDAKKSQMADFDVQLEKAKELARKKAEAERAERERRRQEELARRVQPTPAPTPAPVVVDEPEVVEEDEDDDDEDTFDATVITPDDEDPQDTQVIIQETPQETQETEAPADEGSGGQDLNPSPSTGVSGSAVVSYANQFVGNPYVWGGNSLTTGCDCSGFVVEVYGHFGINLAGSRNSGALRSVGSAVSINNIQPGDIVCYPGHVGLYAGGGTIVEAQSTRAGITNNRSVYCHEILAIRRVV